MAKDNEFRRLPTNPAIEAIKQGIREDEHRSVYFWLGGQLVTVFGLVLLIVGGLKGLAGQPIYQDRLFETIFGFLRTAADSILEMPAQWLPKAWPAMLAFVPSPDFSKIGFGQVRRMSWAQFVEGVGWATLAFGLMFLGAALVRRSVQLKKAAQEMRALLKAALVHLAVLGGPQPTFSGEAEKIVINLQYAIEQVRQSELQNNWWQLPVGIVLLGALGSFMGKVMEKLAGW